MEMEGGDSTVSVALELRTVAEALLTRQLNWLPESIH
jgi:hypothetical protein